MITVPVHDIKSEDELQFIESLGMLEQQQKVKQKHNLHTLTSKANTERVHFVLLCFSYL